MDCVALSQFMLHGMAGLRVADALTMPDIVSVNTNAAATMIGWRGTDSL